HFNNQKIYLEGCRSLLSGNNNHIVFLTHNTDDKNYLTMYNLKNNIINTIQINKDNMSFPCYYHGFVCININEFIIFKEDKMYKIIFNENKNEIEEIIKIDNNISDS